MKKRERRVLPGRSSNWSAMTPWEGPESLKAVLRLRGKGLLSIVRPCDDEGRPIKKSKRNCLRIEWLDRVFVAHPGDAVVTDKAGYYGVLHGYEWAVDHGQFLHWAGDIELLLGEIDEDEGGGNLGTRP